MMIFGLLLIPVVDNNKEFLATFGIYHENYFLTLVLYAHLWIYTFDIPLRLLVKWIERRHEFSADAYSVKIGYGEAQYRALTRNFGKNKDIIFVSRLNMIVNYSHSALLDRLAAIDKLMNEDRLIVPAPELELAQVVGVNNSIQ